ncbi:hypothetical protein B0H14DRAFT_49185 [Mycena olivaceomarginata]|nr:hypothetical protein B0H14DRAFT_49185 [Mycena olivaceomarginata]
MQRSVSQVANDLSSSVGAEASSPDTRTSPATAKRRSSFNIMKHVSVSKSIQSKTVPDTKRRSSLNVLKRLSVSKSTKPRNTVAEIFAPLCLALRPESPNHNSQCLPEIPHFSELVLPSSLNILNLATEGMAIDVNRNLEDEGGALSSALEAQYPEYLSDSQWSPIFAKDSGTPSSPWPKDPVISLLHPPRGRAGDGVLVPRG